MPELTTQTIGLIAILCLLSSAWIMTEILRRRALREAVGNTPVTKAGLKQYDILAPGEAVIMAWSEAGGNPQWHRQMQDEVRKNMPVLARALDRMVEN